MSSAHAKDSTSAGSGRLNPFNFTAIEVAAWLSLKCVLIPELQPFADLFLGVSGARFFALSVQALTTMGLPSPLASELHSLIVAATAPFTSAPGQGQASQSQPFANAAAGRQHTPAADPPPPNGSDASGKDEKQTSEC